MVTQVAGVRHVLDDSDGVALTFDDGPDPEYTPQVLDVLAAASVQATFFCIGNRATKHPEIVRRIRREGHAVGSHSASHHDARSLSLRELTADFRLGHEQVGRTLGERSLLFRPPAGRLDARSIVAIRAAGLRPWLWSIDPEDWVPQVTVSAITAVVERAGAGDIVLLHDGIALPMTPQALDRSATVAALPRIIAAVRRAGLDFVRLP